MKSSLDLTQALDTARQAAEAGGKSRTELLDPQDPRGGVRCVASTAPIFDELCAFVFRKA